MNNQSGKKVFVGLSGGVDSSVSLALLKNAGYDVTGVFIRGWYPDWIECTWRDDRLDAMRVAVSLDIPFITLDLEDEYKRGVIDYLVREYRSGRTPNPDVMCNREVKFGAFFKWAMAHGADYVATGHYAQVEESGIKNYELRKGKDNGKDQSYFLWTLTERELSRIIFPIGHMKKEEVRALAKKYRLPTSDKRDSQGICFLGPVSMDDFLSHYIEKKHGNVLDENGRVIGHHDGVIPLTLGARHGFSVSHKSPDDRPYYIIARDIDRNTITVSHRRPDGTLSSEKSEFVLESVNWIGDKPDSDRSYTARTRHLGQLLSCRVVCDGDVARVIFTTPTTIAPGQSVVIYDDSTCLGGGIVAR